MTGHVVPLRSHHRRRSRQRDPAGTERDFVEVARPAGHGGPPDAPRQHRRPARRRPRARKARNPHRPAARAGAVVGVARRFPEYFADPGPALRLPAIGAATFLGIIVTVGVLASLVFDHFGWIGFQVHPASLWRVAGAVLMVVGVGLVAVF